MLPKAAKVSAAILNMWVHTVMGEVKLSAK